MSDLKKEDESFNSIDFNVPQIPLSPSFLSDQENCNNITDINVTNAIFFKSTNEPTFPFPDAFKFNFTHSIPFPSNIEAPQSDLHDARVHSQFQLPSPHTTQDIDDEHRINHLFSCIQHEDNNDTLRQLYELERESGINDAFSSDIPGMKSLPNFEEENLAYSCINMQTCEEQYYPLSDLEDQSTEVVGLVNAMNHRMKGSASKEWKYECHICNCAYEGKHSRTVWRRHMLEKHQLGTNKKKSRWDKDPNRPKNAEERRERNLECKRQWAKKKRDALRKEKKDTLDTLKQSTKRPVIQIAEVGDVEPKAPTKKARKNPAQRKPRKGKADLIMCEPENKSNNVDCDLVLTNLPAEVEETRVICTNETAFENNPQLDLHADDFENVLTTSDSLLYGDISNGAPVFAFDVSPVTQEQSLLIAQEDADTIGLGIYSPGSQLSELSLMNETECSLSTYYSSSSLASIASGRQSPNSIAPDYMSVCQNTKAISFQPYYIDHGYSVHLNGQENLQQNIDAVHNEHNHGMDLTAIKDMERLFCRDVDSPSFTNGQFNNSLELVNSPALLFSPKPLWERSGAFQ